MVPSWTTSLGGTEPAGRFFHSASSRTDTIRLSHGAGNGRRLRSHFRLSRCCILLCGRPSVNRESSHGVCGSLAWPTPPNETIPVGSPNRGIGPSRRPEHYEINSFASGSPTGPIHADYPSIYLSHPTQTVKSGNDGKRRHDSHAVSASYYESTACVDDSGALGGMASLS